MQNYRVFLQRSVVYEATIEVPACNASEAKEIAEQRAEDDMVAWVQVGGSTQADTSELHTVPS